MIPYSTMIRSIPSRTLAIALCAGMAAPVAAQMDSEKKENTRQAQVSDDASARTTLSFQRVSALIGSDITSRDGTSVASIDDLVIDRGSGDVRYVVVLANDFLGFGGDRLAIPFEVFRFDSAESRYTLDLSDKQIENFGEHVPASWTRFDSGDVESEIRSLAKRHDESNDSTMGSLRNAMNSDAETTELTGTITSIDRMSATHGGEYLVLGVRSNDSDKTSRVILGPSSFMSSSDNALRRNSEVTIEAVQLGESMPASYAATNIESDTGSTELWDDNWNPAWEAGDSNTQGDRGNRSTLISASSLIEAEVTAYDETAGEIQDGILETESGKLAMLLFDPNDNLFGLGDELKCVPWTVTSVGNEAVHIDASTATLEQSEALPDDLTAVSNKAALRSMYQVFGVEVPEFSDRQRTASMTDRIGG